MKKEYIKPNARLIEIEMAGTMLAGSDSNPASLQNVEFSNDEADSKYDVL